MKIACIKPPQPDPKPDCFLAMFTSQLHETKRGKVLIDFPIAFGPRTTERRWVPKKWVAWIEETAPSV